MDKNKNDNGHVSSIYQYIDAHEITQNRKTRYQLFCYEKKRILVKITVHR